MTNSFGIEEKDISLPIIGERLPAELLFKAIRDISKTALMVESGILEEFSSSEIFVMHVAKALKNYYEDKGTHSQFPDDIKRMLGMNND